MKKGFTLIELLAVIALIIIPAVLNVIEYSKKATTDSPTNPMSTTANKQLSADTSSWNTSIKSSIKLISLDEIKEMIGDKWIQSTYYPYYDFFDWNDEKYCGIEYWGSYATLGQNKFGWLFDNTYYYANFGCNSEEKEDYTAESYFTSTYVGNNYYGYS